MGTTRAWWRGWDRSEGGVREFLQSLGTGPQERAAAWDPALSRSPWAHRDPLPPLEGSGEHDHNHDHGLEGYESGTTGSTSTTGTWSAALAGTRSVAPTGDPAIDGLLRGLCWAEPTITYCAPDSIEDYDPNHPKGLVASELSPLTAQQLAAVRFVLDADPWGVTSAASAFSIEGLTGLFISYAGSGTGAGTIAAINRSSTATASAYYPNGASYGGDVFFGGSGVAPQVGNYDWKVVLHELGHALGLKHGQEVSAYGALPVELDSSEFSVMTYRSYVGQSLDTGYTNEAWGYAQSFMMLDIAALQHMYGADWSANAGDTTYRWMPGSGATLIDGQVALQPGANRIFLTIWDGGGQDTYDLSAYTTALRVDLAPGGHSVLSTAQLADLDQFSSDPARVARGNVFNALLFQGDTRSLIENAVGGTGDDWISGNQANNRLEGGAGNDTLLAGLGADRLIGGLGRDTLHGGTDAKGDVFVFRSTRDTAVGANRDVVLNFTSGYDDVDLSMIDVRASTAGDDAFAFAGKSAKAFSVWWTSVSDGVLLRGDVTGDRKADFEILLKGATTVVADDLIL